MGLAIIIPVWNDQAALDRLMARVRALGVFDQVIVVDDGSDPPVRLSGPACGPARPAPLLLRHDRPQGPGAARNRALHWIATDHALFFDSDDWLTDEFPRLWHDLAGQVFDFCLFRHHDTRAGAMGHRGQMPYDDVLWRVAGLGGAALEEVGGRAACALAETTNVPWNKIYRTEFLRAAGLRCSETLVHEDIALHWPSFLAARRILVSSRIAAVHEVTPGGDRLTNRTGPERLAVFDPLGQVADRLRAAGADGADLLTAFLRFTSGLLLWIRGGIEPDLRDRFDAAAADFLRITLTPPLFARLAREDPVLALRLTLQMVGPEPRPC